MSLRGEFKNKLSKKNADQFGIFFDQSATITRLVNPAMVITENQVEQLFKSNRIYSAAQGEEDSTLKFYLYSKHVRKNKKSLTIIKAAN